MPATTRTPRGSRQPLGPLGSFGPPPPPGSPIAGPPPASVLSGILPNPTRQGSQRMHPLQFAFNQKPKQDAPPANPAERPLQLLITEFLAAEIEPRDARYLASLDTAIQREIARFITELPARPIAEQVGDVVATMMTLALTPGNPTMEDVREAIADMLDIRPGTPYSEDELTKARARAIEGAGTDAPEPTDEEIFAEAAAERREELIERELIVPTYEPPVYSPGETEPPGPETEE